MEDLARALRRVQPVSIRAHLANDTVRELAPPGGKRKRWSHVVATITKLSWVQLELLNAKGQTLEVVDNDAPADELEDIGDVSSRGEVAQYLGLMLKAQEVAGRQTARLVDSNLKLCEVVMSRLTNLERMFEGNLALAQRAVARSERDRDRDDGDGLMSNDAVGALVPLLAAKAMGLDPKDILRAQARAMVEPDPDPEAHQ